MTAMMIAKPRRPNITPSTILAVFDTPFLVSLAEEVSWAAAVSALSESGTRPKILPFTVRVPPLAKYACSLLSISSGVGSPGLPGVNVAFTPMLPAIIMNRSQHNEKRKSIVMNY